MTHARRTTAALFAGTLALAASGCGGGSSKHATTTSTGQDTTTTGAQTTTQATTPAKKKRPSLASTPARTLSFSGNGPKELGVVRIPTNSTIKWTDDAPAATRLFQIIPASVKVQSPVNSREASGQAPIRKGAYHGFLVNAVGHWTMSIVPGGA